MTGGEVSSIGHGLRRWCLSGQFRQRLVNARQAARAAQHFQRLEKRWRDRATRNGDADSHKELARLETQFIGKGAHGRFHRGSLPLLQPFQQRLGATQRGHGLLAVHAFANERLWLVVQIVGEEERSHLSGLAQGLHAFLLQLQHASNIGAVQRALDDIGQAALARRALQERDRALGQVFRAEHADINAVHPEQTLRVEHGVGNADAVQRESSDHLLAAENISLVVVRPAQQDQVVDDRFWQVSLLLVIAERLGTVPLAQLFTVLAQHDRQMNPDGLLPAIELIRQHMIGGAGQPVVGTARDMADIPQVIVYDVCQMVGWHAIGFEQDDVLKLAVLKDDFAAQQVVHNGLALQRHSQPDDKWIARLLVAAALFRREIAAASIIARRFDAARLLLFVHFVQTLFGTVAAIGAAALNQFMGIVLIDGFALRLVIGANRAADHRPFVGHHIEPAKPIEQRIDAFGNKALAVGVFNADKKLAAMPTRKEPDEDAGAIAANMLDARWTGREAHTHGLARLSSGGWGERAGTLRLRHTKNSLKERIL